jgi:RHS repeat-associated protein
MQMQLGSEAQIPDGLLAANALLGENSHQGFGASTHTLYQGSGVAISSTALGIPGTLYDGRIRCRYTGKERDAESGLDYFGARYYASNMGRWMSPDWSAKQEPVPYSKLDDPQTLNLYGYVGNNPLSRADADGHCWWQAACDAAQKAFGTASQLLNDGLQRVGYTNAASQLSGPGASAERKALQVATRAKLSPIGGAITDAAKASRASQLAGKTAEQLVESASRTNAGVNALGTASTAVGAAGVALGVGAVALDTVNAPAGQKLDAAMNGGARLGGSALGAEIGGAVGALGGPIGAVVGSLLGGAGGQQIVTTIQNAPPMDPQTQLELGGVP